MVAHRSALLARSKTCCWALAASETNSFAFAVERVRGSVFVKFLWSKWSILASSSSSEMIIDSNEMDDGLGEVVRTEGVEDAFVNGEMTEGVL